jgi:hypothetical protein
MNGRLSLFLALFCLGLLILLACEDESVGPPPAADRFGLTGLVLDTLGQGLDSVGVFCLFNSPFIPPVGPSSMTVSRIDEADTFDFALYQNFPNPFSHSTFIRFSIPRAAVIVLSLTDRLNGSMIAIYEDTLLQGLYQVYFHRLVDSLSLRNGPYTCVLEATAEGGFSYTEHEEVFVVSDSGSPSATTDIDGSYLFDYDSAFVGDSVMSTWNGDDIYPYELTNSVYLLFTRDGYQPEVINATIFPNLLLRRDVVLTESNGP